MSKSIEKVLAYIKNNMLKVTAVLVVFIIIINSFVLTPCTAVGESMLPTIHSGQMCVVNRINKEFKRGDIVYCKDPMENQNLIKRVIGLPGETVEIKNGNVYIDGEKISDFAEIQDKESFLKPVELKESEFFVMGDNRSHSRDSREFGPLNEGRIIGKVIILPF